MRKFHFKLATILHLRKTREEEALRILGKAQREHQEKIQAKAALVADLQSSLKRRENLADQPIDIIPFRLEDEFIEGQKHRIVRAEREVMRAARGVEKALQHFLHCRRKTRMMEILEEKHREEFRKDQSKREQKLVDDMILMRERMKEKEMAA